MDQNVTKAERFDMAIMAAIDRWCASPIVWGKDDCLMGLAAIVQQVEGIDLGALYRGRYRSQRGAIRVLGKGGVPGALARAARRLRWQRMVPVRCQSGALGVLMTPAGPAGIMRYGDMWVGRVSDGLGLFPSDMIEKAWGYE